MKNCLRSTSFLLVACFLGSTVCGLAFEVKPVSTAQAEEYKLDPAFYKKATEVQGILIATSAQVPDVVHLEAAYQFDQVMQNINPQVAQRIREQKVLCLLVGAQELTSDLPQFTSQKTGKELDFYNWRQRGFLTQVGERRVVLFAEEDVLEYEGGMQIESILIHEFGHVIDFAGLDKSQKARLTAAFENAKQKGLYQDGSAALRFRRITSASPVSLAEALQQAFPTQPPALFRACLAGGDILVNGQPTTVDVKVTQADKVLIVFGGPKNTYSLASRAEYWAEGLQNWYDTNRTMDHDHNHVHTRAQLKTYDPVLAQLLGEVLGDSPWRFTSPRGRAGTAHLANYDPAQAPKKQQLEHIRLAGLDYFDTYWKDYWQRLLTKHAPPSTSPATGK